MTTVKTMELPETVVQVWGPAAARDFSDWLEERLATTPVSPQVSAFVARQHVNVLMLEQVSNLLLAGDPRLVRAAAGDWRWRVPVSLTLPGRGRVGQVGEVEVDAHYGQAYYDDAMLAHIADEAQHLASQISDSPA